MCDPGTLIVASTVAAAAGSAVNAAQSAAQSRYEARVADQNAKLTGQQVADAQARTRLEAARLYRKAGQVQGQQLAAQAANGVDLGFGSALRVQEDAAMVTAEDAGQIYKAGDQEVRGFDIEVGNYRAKAQGARQAAKGAIIKGAFDVGSSILGGAREYSKYKSR